MGQPALQNQSISLIYLRHMLNHTQGMRQGIITSGAFILFLSEGILTRPFCRFLMVPVPSRTRFDSCGVLCISGQFEIRAAIAHKKPLVLIRESIGLSSRLPRPLKGRAVLPARRV